MSGLVQARLRRVILVALFAVAGCAAKTKTDEPAKDFAAPDLNGRPVRLRDLRGKVVLLNFWGMWCGPCRQEFPELVQLHNRVKDRGFEILAVDVGDEDEEAIKAYVTGAGAKFIVVRDQGASSLYSVASFPTNVVIDQSGVVRFVLHGYGSDSVAQISGVVEKLLLPPSVK